MATALRKPSPSVPPAAEKRSSLSVWERITKVFDAIYRFLASLKLAVISLSTLAGVLAYATFFESWHGGSAAREWIYRSPGFAILLAFLGANILCAALIRYPWKRRQIGFLVTHVGLLTVLAGSWISLQSADEGQVGMLEGQTMTQLVRRDDAIMRVRKLDPHTGEPVRDFGEFELPFQPGHFQWGADHPRPHGIVGSLFHGLTGGAFEDRNPTELLTRPKDPFQLKIKQFLPASVPAVVHEADPSGSPMLKIRPQIKGRACPRWSTSSTTRNAGWAPIPDSGAPREPRCPRGSSSCSATSRTWLLTSSTRPSLPARKAAVRIHYKDRTGKDRSFDSAARRAGRQIDDASRERHPCDLRQGRDP